jgi:hypothetical protein
MKGVFSINNKRITSERFICMNDILIYIILYFRMLQSKVTGKYCLQILTWALALTFGAKVYSQPNPISVESVSLYKHSTNSTDLVGPVAGESTDSVSVGSTTKYYCMPDGSINSSFNYGTDPFANVTSTYNWSVTPALASGGVVAVPAHNTALHYRQIEWTSTGTGNIQVTERSNLGCDGNTLTTPVEVIAVPTVQYPSATNSDCFTGTESSLNYVLAGIPVVWTSTVSGKRQLKINITISCTNAGFGIVQTHNNITVTETGAGTGTFDCPIVLNYYGVYTITLTAISDRISAKTSINGTVGVNSTYTFVLSKNPVSNPIYHITNN